MMVTFMTRLTRHASPKSVMHDSRGCLCTSASTSTCGAFEAGDTPHQTTASFALDFGEHPKRNLCSQPLLLERDPPELRSAFAPLLHRNGRLRSIYSLMGLATMSFLL